MKKKIGAMLMAGIMACTMTAGVAFTTGCGGGGAEPDFVMPEGGFDTEKPVTIMFYHTMNQDLRKVLDSYITDFETLYPNISVKYKAVGGYDDVLSQINTEILDGSQPNIAYCYPDHVAVFNEADAVQTLNDFLPDGAFKDYTVKQADGTTVSLNITQQEKESFNKVYYNEGYKFGDGSKMYTLPFSKSTEVMFYNKDYFDDNKLKVPETWDEMEEVCKQIQTIEAAKGNTEFIPFGYDSEANWFINMCEQYGQGTNTYTSASGKHFLFDNASNRSFVERFKKWYDDKYFTTQTINKGYTSDLFINKQSFMCIGSSAGAKNQLGERKDGELPFEVGIASIPQLKQSSDPNAANYDANYKPKVISQGPSVCIFKKKDPQEVLASWLFVKYLITNVNFQAEFSATNGYTPVLTEEKMRTNTVYAGFLDNANGKENLTYLAAKYCMEHQNDCYTSDAFLGSSTARAQVGNLMVSVFNGSSSISDAFKKAIYECEYAAG